MESKDFSLSVWLVCSQCHCENSFLLVGFLVVFICFFVSLFYCCFCLIAFVGFRLFIFCFHFFFSKELKPWGFNKKSFPCLPSISLLWCITVPMFPCRSWKWYFETWPAWFTKYNLLPPVTRNLLSNIFPLALSNHSKWKAQSNGKQTLLGLKRIKCWVKPLTDNCWMNSTELISQWISPHQPDTRWDSSCFLQSWSMDVSWCWHKILAPRGAIPGSCPIS